MPEPLSSTLLQAIYCSAQAATHAWLFMAFRQLYVDFLLDIGIQESSHNVYVLQMSTKMSCNGEEHLNTHGLGHCSKYFVEILAKFLAEAFGHQSCLVAPIVLCF